MEVGEKLVGENDLLGAVLHAQPVGISHWDCELVPLDSLQERRVAELKPVEVSRPLAASDLDDRRQFTAFGNKSSTDLAAAGLAQNPERKKRRQTLTQLTWCNRIIDS